MSQGMGSAKPFQKAASTGSSMGWYTTPSRDPRQTSQAVADASTVRTRKVRRRPTNSSGSNWNADDHGPP